MGMTRDEYDQPRLSNAPFLYYNFRAKTYEGLDKEIKRLLQELPIPNPDNPDGPPLTAPPPEQTGTETIDSKRRLHGPVYLFVAFDIEQNFIDAYLYLPSMTKDGKKWPNYHFLGLSHTWMHRMIHSPGYFIARPRNNCQIRIDNRLEVGCRTDESNRCMQSKKAHRKMKLYRKKKARDAYPAIYYRMYQINLNNDSLKDYIHPGSLPDLQRNILPMDIDMYVGCRYSLISQNNQYIFMLGPYWFGLYRNMGNEDFVALCKFKQFPKMVVPIKQTYFKGVFRSHLVLEENQLVIKSSLTEEGTEEPVFSMQLTRPGASAPYCLVLENDGSLVVYDYANEVVSSNMFDQPSDEFIDEYDPVKDRRERMINLVAYLKVLRLYKEIPQLQESIEREGQQSELLMANDNVETYDSKKDYIRRLELLLEFLISTKRIKPDDPNRYGFTIADFSQEKDTTSFDYSRFNNEFGDGKKKDDDKSKNASDDPQAALEAQAEKPDEELNDLCEQIQDEDKQEECYEDLETMERKKERDLDTLLHNFEKAYGAASYSQGELTQHHRDNMMCSKEGLETLREQQGEGQEGVTEPRYICPIPRNTTYTSNHDLYCRLLALRDSIRRMNRPLVVLDPENLDGASGTANIQLNTGGIMDEYDKPKDILQRLEMAKLAFQR